MSYLEERRKYIEAGRPLKTKDKKPIAKKSEKRLKKEAEEKERLGGDDRMDRFFETARKRMVGVCQCGCTKKSSKHEDDRYRCSVCHIFPQRLFKSIADNQLNWVERAFWATEKGSSCHTNMDNRSMDKWPMFADWEDIKERFHELSPLLTDEERATKFYTHLERLVYAV